MKFSQCVILVLVLLTIVVGEIAPTMADDMPGGGESNCRLKMGSCDDCVNRCAEEKQGGKGECFPGNLCSCVYNCTPPGTPQLVRLQRRYMAQPLCSIHLGPCDSIETCQSGCAKYYKGIGKCIDGGCLCTSPCP